tara:strand:+ start:14927 stop:16747 length:1821 start_codon:yes stop_codon:yes gene_type:complete
MNPTPFFIASAPLSTRFVGVLPAQTDLLLENLTLTQGRPSLRASRWVFQAPDGELWLYVEDKATGKLVCCDRLMGYAKQVKNITMTQTGQIVTLSMCNKVCRWTRGVGGDWIYELELAFYLSSSVFALSPDGRAIVGESLHELRLYISRPNGRWEVNTLKKDLWPPMTCVAFSPDGQSFVSGSDDNTLRVWHFDASGSWLSTELQEHTEAVIRVVFLLDGQAIISESVTGAVKCWKLEITGAWIHYALIGGVDVKGCAAFSPFCQVVDAGLFSSRLHLSGWGLNGGRASIELEGSRYVATCVAFSPNGDTIACGTEYGAVRLWTRNNINGDWVRTELSGIVGLIRCVVFSSDGKSVVIGLADGVIGLWVRDEHGRWILTELRGHGGSVTCVAISPDGQSIVSGSNDCTLRLWSCAAGGLWESITLQQCTIDRVMITCVAFSPNGQSIVSGSNHNLLHVYVRDIEGGWVLKRKRDFTDKNAILGALGPSKTVKRVVFSPDGQVIICGLQDGTVCSWRLAEDVVEELHFVDGIKSLQVIPLSHATTICFVVTDVGTHCLSTSTVGVNPRARFQNIGQYLQARELRPVPPEKYVMDQLMQPIPYQLKQI